MLRKTNDTERFKPFTPPTRRIVDRLIIKGTVSTHGSQPVPTQLLETVGPVENLRICESCGHDYSWNSDLGSTKKRCPPCEKNRLAEYFKMKKRTYYQTKKTEVY